MTQRAPKIDLAGRSFGRLTVTGLDPRQDGPKRHARWLCRCDCGTVRSVAGNSLRSGVTLSCGCLMRDVLSQPRKRPDVLPLAPALAWVAPRPPDGQTFAVALARAERILAHLKASAPGGMAARLVAGLVDRGRTLALVGAESERLACYLELNDLPQPEDLK